MIARVSLSLMLLLLVLSMHPLSANTVVPLVNGSVILTARLHTGSDNNFRFCTIRSQSGEDLKLTNPLTENGTITNSQWEKLKHLPPGTMIEIPERLELAHKVSTNGATLAGICKNDAACMSQIRKLNSLRGSKGRRSRVLPAEIFVLTKNSAQVPPSQISSAATDLEPKSAAPKSATLERPSTFSESQPVNSEAKNPKPQATPTPPLPWIKGLISIIFLIISFGLPIISVIILITLSLIFRHQLYILKPSSLLFRSRARKALGDISALIQRQMIVEKVSVEDNGTIRILPLHLAVEYTESGTTLSGKLAFFERLVQSYESLGARLEPALTTGNNPQTRFKVVFTRLHAWDPKAISLPELVTMTEKMNDFAVAFLRQFCFPHRNCHNFLRCRQILLPERNSLELWIAPGKGFDFPVKTDQNVPDELRYALEQVSNPDFIMQEQNLREEISDGLTYVVVPFNFCPQAVQQKVQV